MTGQGEAMPGARTAAMGLAAALGEVQASCKMDVGEWATGRAERVE